jgi:hypothetical protein
MVHVRDDGVYDEPLDKIWKYLMDENPSVHSHEMIRNTKTLEQKGTELTQELELLNPDGKTTRVETWRFVFNPPKGFEIEALSGVSKGTKYSHLYIPIKDQTRVEVEGDFHMEGMDDASTRQAALGFLAQVFTEDQVNLRRYK